MPDTVSLPNWMRHIRQEYLETFVRHGGASVKFVVTPESQRDALVASLRSASGDLGFQFATVQATETRVHMPQDIYYALARQTNWRLLARRRILQLAASRGFKVEGIAPELDDDIYERIERANGAQPNSCLMELRPELQQSVLKSLEMMRDFRVAMMQLCVLESVQSNAEYGGQALLDWLTGANVRMSNVRHFSIFTAINRTTGRAFLESALHWIRETGQAGTVILLDNARVTVPRDPRDGYRFYQRAAVMDHYELLREFVDSADRLKGTLLVVSTNTDFTDTTPGGRGYGAYPALQTRVMDDVRDRNLANPVASLVRLGQG